MQWFTLTLFAIWLVVAVLWLSSGLRRRFSHFLNAKQRRLTLIFLALFGLSLLIVPWSVNAQLLGFPIISQISYGLIWSPPSGGISQELMGIISPQGGILPGLILLEWLVLGFSYCFFLRLFNDSTSNEPKHDA